MSLRSNHEVCGKTRNEEEFGTKNDKCERGDENTKIIKGRFVNVGRLLVL
jgi:hypothetical protein